MQSRYLIEVGGDKHFFCRGARNLAEVRYIIHQIEGVKRVFRLSDGKLLTKEEIMSNFTMFYTKEHKEK